MGANLDALVAGIRAKRNEKLPQAKERLAKLEAARAAVTATQVKATAVAHGNAELLAKLGAVDYVRAVQLLDAAILSANNAVNRLKRESINIGVAGKARQGKSQILQMLTGLGDQQIPTGSGPACTAARSIVHNGQVVSARVHYLTKDRFLAKKVYPSYDAKGTSRFALGLTSRRPASVEEFRDMQLPAVEPHDGTPTDAEDNWDKVLLLQQILRTNSDLIARLGSDPDSVDIASVRNYLVKDNGETLHNVVDRVEITTPFAIGLPEGLTVYDLPGLSDPTPGIEEDMRDSLTNDADIVLFMRKAVPDGEGEFWKHEDNDAIDLMKAVFSVDEVKPADWIQLVLNLDSRSGHVNKLNTEHLRKTVTRGFVPVVCDCGKSEAVRQMINDNIERLVGNVARIDDLRIRQADADYQCAISAVRSVADAVASAVGQTIARSTDFDEDGHFESFWALLRKPFKQPVEKQLEGIEGKLRESLKTAFGAAYTRMKDIYSSCENAPDAEFPPEFPVFTKARLVTLLEGAHGTKEAVDRAARNQLSAVVGLLRLELQTCCEELRDIYLRSVVQSVTRDNKSIQSLLDNAPEQERDNPVAVFRTLEMRLEEGSDSVETLKSALENLLRFDVSYETQLLPYLFDRPELSDKLDPYAPDSELSKLEGYLDSNFAMNFTAQAEVLFNALKNYSLNWISPLANARSEGPCQDVSAGIMRVVKANYRNFIALFIWGEKTESEWKKYMRENAATLWPDDFARAASQSETGRQLRDLIAQLRKSVQ